MYYYGFMVSELTGEIDKLEGEFDWKPEHESCGFAYTKWYKLESKRDELLLYTKEQINEIKSR